VLLCCDNEGCIVDAKGRPFDLPALAELAAAIERSPLTFTICTGRSVPYVEAMVQVLGLVGSDVACVCEGGGVLYSPISDRYEVLAAPVDEESVRAVLPAGGYREELGKVVGFSVYPEPGFTVDLLYELVMAGGLDRVNITRSVAAVDITPAGVDKTFGIDHLLKRQGADWSDVVAVGDSWNDLPMLRRAGLSACPANSIPEVKAIVDYVSPFPATRGVTDILRWAATPTVVV
jgi:hydroxymethylpyrimidine pyrophosphatase-like HAD family hydrolase